MAHSYRLTHNQKTNHNFIKLKRYMASVFITFLWAVFPGLIRKIVFKHFFIPHRVSPSQGQTQLLQTGTAFELTVNTDTIKCWQWGHGPALLCVHGWNGIGLHFHGLIKRTIDLGFSVIVFDGPWHGMSPGKTCSYFQMTDVVRTFLTQPRFQVAGLIGHSFGAAATINGLSKENIDLPAVLIAPALEMERLIDNAFSQYGIPKEIYMELIGLFEEKYGYSFKDDDPIHLLSDNTQTIMVIHDALDQTIPYHRTQKIVRQYSSFGWMGTTDLGHKRILTNDQVISAALNFIRLHTDQLN